jgi:ribonuclease Z
MLEVCLLGTGGMMPLPGRWLTSLLVRYSGRMLLIDCGEGTQIPIKLAEWGFKAIDVILFTHYHADHIAGLPGLLLTIGNSGRVEPLTLVGPIGLNKVAQGLCVISPELPYELQIIELSDTDKLETLIGGITIKNVPVDHNLPCFAYSIELKRQGKFDINRANKLGLPVEYWKLLQKGQIITLEDRIIKPEMVLGEDRKGIKVCYCTDSRPTEELVEFIKEADLFICEGMYGDKDDAEKAVNKKHMMFSEAGLLAKQGKVKELWLTHYSPSLTAPEKFIDSVREIFINTSLGNDLLKQNLKWDLD